MTRLTEWLCLQFLKPFLQKAAFRFLFGQRQGPLVRLAGFGGSSQATAQIGASRVGQVVVGQITIRQDVVNDH